MDRPTLIVFLRRPAIGVGKTRLARDVGAVEAWRIYRTMSLRLLRRLRDPRWRLVVRITPERPGRPGAEPQGPGDLGARLERALRRWSKGPVAVVGTDAPEVTRARVAGAFTAVKTGGAVFGPAADGGFWLMALSPRRARRLRLAGIRWSSGHTLGDARAAIGPARLLETLADIDDGADLKAWRKRAGRWAR